ncbi:hypothetical protein [Sporomusa sphaeroides]|uniref:Preprotein translocase subunit Tim44 n=2 Tax=Sporomusa TaxID=2375 RepID=A0ABP2CF28_9FIRM|nr:hypothetical protein [Sporomusa sphaeroides]OLS57775.1 hypothetical protein SPSPH_13030 [Sporomusa sphaeroides DSM 2875]CVK21010.1 hypothetical protein SSPH_03687 [Sporomusa sphaeroides DSM 2875]SCM80853.1 conserved membrane hypothetical protein [uncultured Sporomusa sp.]
MRKLLLLTFVFMFAFNAVSFAAIGGSRRAPSFKAPPTQSSPVKNNNSSDYKPSAPAQSYNEKAPAAAAKPNPQAAAAQQATTGGGFLRTAGLLGGGMLLGSMLGGMFGFGEAGMFASIMGIVFNVILLAAVFMAGRYLWDKFKNRDKQARR